MRRRWPWWAWINPWLFGRRISRAYDDLLESVVWEAKRDKERDDKLWGEESPF